MRKAMNENPTVQIAMVIGLGLLAAIMLYMQVLRKPAEEPAAPAATGLAATAPGVVAPAGTAPAPVAPPSGAPVPEATVTEEGFVAGPGLPAPVADAYSAGQAIVLLVINPKGIDDRIVERSLTEIQSRGDTAVFVVDADEVSDYSRITEGVGVDRAPALVVISPKSVTDGVPEATVSYGFRGVDSIVQTVEDALYKGPEVTYYP